MGRSWAQSQTRQSSRAPQLTQNWRGLMPQTFDLGATRQDEWVLLRQADLHQLGDVTILLSKKQQNYGPRRIKISVTHLLGVSPGEILNQYAI